jgi:hypothetical protein
VRCAGEIIDKDRSLDLEFRFEGARRSVFGQLFVKDLFRLLLSFGDLAGR